MRFPVTVFPSTLAMLMRDRTEGVAGHDSRPREVAQVDRPCVHDRVVDDADVSALNAARQGPPWISIPGFVGFHSGLMVRFSRRKPRFPPAITAKSKLSITPFFTVTFLRPKIERPLSCRDR